MSEPVYEHEFVIDRGEWLPKEAQGVLSRLRAAGKDGRIRYCCLGLALRSYGVSDGVIGNRAMPVEVVGDFPKWLRGHGTQPAGKCARANDAHGEFAGVSLADREAFIVKTFAEHGVKVTFTGDLFPEEPKP